MPSRIMRWINERWPLDAVIRWSLEEEMAGESSYAYVFGSAVLLTFLLQVVTGVFQFVYLVPTIDHGYDSLSYLRIEVPFGWLIHGLHYWGAAAMLILVGLHMCANFVFGAYKHPRQLTWIIGVFLVREACDRAKGPDCWNPIALGIDRSCSLPGKGHRSIPFDR